MTSSPLLKGIIAAKVVKEETSSNLEESARWRLQLEDVFNQCSRGREAFLNTSPGKPGQAGFEGGLGRKIFQLGVL